MSERHKPHNGRDKSGHFKVKREDLDDLQADPEGAEHLRDDVRLGGAVADVGPRAADHAERIHQLVEENREDVEKLVRTDRDQNEPDQR